MYTNWYNNIYVKNVLYPHKNLSVVAIEIKF